MASFQARVKSERASSASWPISFASWQSHFSQAPMARRSALSLSLFVQRVRLLSQVTFLRAMDSSCIRKRLVLLDGGPFGPARIGPFSRSRQSGSLGQCTTWSGHWCQSGSNIEVSAPKRRLLSTTAGMAKELKVKLTTFILPPSENRIQFNRQSLDCPFNRKGS